MLRGVFLNVLIANYQRYLSNCKHRKIFSASGALLVAVCEKTVLKMTLSCIFMGGNHQMMT